MFFLKWSLWFGSRWFMKGIAMKGVPRFEGPKTSGPQSSGPQTTNLPLVDRSCSWGSWNHFKVTNKKRTADGSCTKFRWTLLGWLKHYDVWGIFVYNNKMYIYIFVYINTWMYIYIYLLSWFCRTVLCFIRPKWNHIWNSVMFFFLNCVLERFDPPFVLSKMLWGHFFQKSNIAMGRHFGVFWW